MLTLVATPIGNLQDISSRAKESIGTCDVLLCEDTRHSLKLLNCLDLAKPAMVSLHKFNESAKQEQILQWLREGKNVVLISDAGTPGICDPGARLVRACHDEHIRVSIIPGPCAFACAFAVSGIETTPVQFLGFLPKKETERKKALQELLVYPGTSIVYESPNRLLSTIELTAEIDPSWKITLTRELTKIHEQVLVTTASELLSTPFEAKGECTIVFHPNLAEHLRPDDKAIVRQVEQLRKQFSCSLKEAVELTACHLRLSQREVYQTCIS